MTTTVELVYEDGKLRPLTPLAFTEGTRITATLTDRSIPERMDAAYLLTLPDSERDQILAAAAAAPLYEADLALLIVERELTTFTALDHELFFESDCGGKAWNCDSEPKREKTEFD